MQYTMEDSYQEGFHQDLRRDLYNSKRASNSSSNHTKNNFQDGLPLFERYAYLSPRESDEQPVRSGTDLSQHFSWVFRSA